MTDSERLEMAALRQAIAVAYRCLKAIGLSPKATAYLGEFVRGQR